MKRKWSLIWIFGLFFALAFVISCNNDDDVSDDIDDVTDDISDDVDDITDDDNGNGTGNSAVLIIIDDDSIDNGDEPNDFSEEDVNDDISEIGQRQELRYFADNTDEEITLYTGQVGDEGWFALTSTPTGWDAVGPSENGARNYLEAGPGLGGDEDDDLLDEIPDVIPLRATSLAMLTGQVVIAVVYDSDVSINYDPIIANLQGENLGVVAFEVLEVTARTDDSDSDLPEVRIKILDAATVIEHTIYLFSNPEIPESSSEPEDVTPPEEIPEISLEATE
ncbi:hypothetical protein ACW6QP_07830 [Salegentibacter sp. HM20]